MPDANNPAPAPVTANAKKSPAAHGDVKQDLLAELTLAEQLTLSAQKEVYAPLFAEGGIDAAFLTALLADITGAHQEASVAVAQTTGRKVATLSEADIKRRLVDLLRGVQARARQQFAATAPARLKEYHIGDKVALGANRPHLEQCAADLLKSATEDALPGVSAATQAAIAQALTDYKNAQKVQTTAQTKASGTRTTLEEKVAAIAACRRKLQFAADATWPPGNPANVAIRREFKLPPKKSLKA